MKRSCPCPELSTEALKQTNTNTRHKRGTSRIKLYTFRKESRTKYGDNFDNGEQRHSTVGCSSICRIVLEATSKRRVNSHSHTTVACFTAPCSINILHSKCRMQDCNNFSLFTFARCSGFFTFTFQFLFFFLKRPFFWLPFSCLFFFAFCITL